MNIAMTTVKFLAGVSAKGIKASAQSAKASARAIHERAAYLSSTPEDYQKAIDLARAEEHFRERRHYIGQERELNDTQHRAAVGSINNKVRLDDDATAEGMTSPHYSKLNYERGIGNIGVDRIKSLDEWELEKKKRANDEDIRVLKKGAKARDKIRGRNKKDT